MTSSRERLLPNRHGIARRTPLTLNFFLGLASCPSEDLRPDPRDLPMTTHLKSAKPGTPVLLGIPFDANSSWLRGAAGAPPIIRVALGSDSSNSSTETGVDLSAEGAYCDAGDLKFDFQTPFAAIESKVGELLDHGLRPVCLGGDHSITLPIVSAFGERIPGLTVIHFDAHPDLYDELEGNRLSHACPFARIMEKGAAKRLIQVGIRTMNGHQREQANKFGVEVVEMRHLPALDRMKVDGPIYISFDMRICIIT